jgi:hypothetical protein
MDLDGCPAQGCGERWFATVVNRQYRNAGRVGLGPLPALSANKPDKSIGKCPDQQRCDAPGREAAKNVRREQAVAASVLDWQRIRYFGPAAVSAESDQKANGSSLIPARPRGQRRRCEEWQMESGPGS